jgi:hypothetical protein
MSKKTTKSASASRNGEKPATNKDKATPAVSKKREAFVRLAEGRTAAAIQGIRLIGNLSNTSMYEYTDDDVKKMLQSIRDELASTEARFEAETHKKSRSPVKFAL